MKIVVLDTDQLRLWFRNRPVLVDSQTGEAILEEGHPKHPNRLEVQEMLRSIRKKKLFDVEYAGKKCHYVSGRDFLKRVFIRAHQRPVQLRDRTGHVLGNARPKFLGHDLANSEVKPIDGRPYKQAQLPESLTSALIPKVNRQVPPPAHCPICNQYTKPLGCRDDEHHFVCKYHDDWEAYRKELLAKLPQRLPHTTTMPEHTDEDVWMVISLEDGTQLRPATKEEVELAKERVEGDELPIIEIDGTSYGIASPSLALPEKSQPCQPSASTQKIS